MNRRFTCDFFFHSNRYDLGNKYDSACTCARCYYFTASLILNNFDIIPAGKRHTRPKTNFCIENFHHR